MMFDSIMMKQKKGMRQDTKQGANMNNDHGQAKQTLESLKEELLTRIRKIEDHLYNPQDELNEHWDDQAIAMRDNDMRKNLLVEAKQELQYVYNALSQIENGTYGECSVCEEAIEPKRLEAVPYATLCMQHAQ